MDIKVGMQAWFEPTEWDRAKQIRAYRNDTQSNFKIYLFLNIFFGFFSAPLSQGLLIYLLFYALWEAKFAYSVRCEYTVSLAGERLVLVLAGIMSFMFGRIILMRDHHPYRMRYPHCPTYGQLWSEFTGMGGEDCGA